MRNKNDSALETGRERSRRRRLADTALRAKAASLGVPVFILRMFGWRKVRLASMHAAPRRRHD